MHKRTLYLLALGVFGIGTTEFGVIGILPQLARVFNVPVERAGWLLSGFALVIAVCAPFMALAFSQVDRRKALLLTLAVFTVSNLVSMVAPSFTILLMARMVPAFLHPVFWSVALATAAGAVPPEQSTRAVGLVFGGFTVASVLGVPISTWMADLLGWPAAFAFGAGVNALAFVGLLSLPSMPPVAGRHATRVLQVLRKPALWIQLLMALLMISAMYASYGYLAVYLEKVTHMNGAQISLMLFLFGAAGVGGNWLAGRLLTRSISATTLVFILALCGVHVLVFFAGPYLLPMMAMVVVWGFVNTAGFLVSNVNVTAAAPEAPEFVNSIFTSCGNLAVTIGASSGGFAIAQAGPQVAIWTSVGLLGLALAVWPVSKKVL